MNTLLLPLFLSHISVQTQTLLRNILYTRIISSIVHLRLIVNNRCRKVYNPVFDVIQIKIDILLSSNDISIVFTYYIRYFFNFR